ncbi:MAG: 2Fe-2S iron-sulfur cluster-binding protein [Actinomycetia bacterium]|nr:2Fe-2S iron-sulfur cluster-binding protein [Actinomycetes bacterium]
MTESSVAVTFAVPDELSATFARVPGQHVTLKTSIGTDVVRRSYSICSPLSSGDLTVGIKHLEGGVFSSFANDGLSVGDVVEVTPPAGDFTIQPEPAAENHYIAVVAGSGITPVLAMVASVLPAEPQSHFTLIYGNRDGRSIMFLEELDALKNRFPDRLSLIHILSRESHLIPLFEGRIDQDKLRTLFSSVVDAGTATAWYLCGPAGMVHAARDVLTAGGVGPDAIHDELFYAGGDGPPSVAKVDLVGSTVRFTLAGRTSTVTVDPEGSPILDHALAVRPEAPFSCRGGACASCRAVVTSGEVTMDKNWSLNQEEVDAGQILTCQAHPVSEVVELTYDV